MSQIKEFTNLEVKKLIRRLSVWYRLRSCIKGTQIGLLIGLGIGLGIALVALTTTVGDQLGLGKPELTRLFFAAAFTGSIGSGLLHYFWPASPNKITRFIDNYFQLEDRVSTAAELITFKIKSSHQLKDIEKKQIEDAVHHGNKIQPGLNFFISISRFYLFSSFILVAGIIILNFIGEPYFSQLKYKQAIRQAVQEEILKLEELQNSLPKNELLSPEDKEELEQLFQETIQKLDQTETLEQALAVLNQAEQELKSFNDPEISEQVQSLEQLGNQLLQDQEDSSNVLNEFADQLNSGDLSSAAESLKDIDLDDISFNEIEKLEKQLSSAADNVSDTLPSLSEALNNAAEALQDGNIDAAQEALSQAAESIEKTSNQKAKVDSALQAETQIKQSASKIIQSGPSQLTQSGSGQPNSSGQAQSGNGQEINSSNNQGSGSTDQTSGGNGSGSGKGTENLGEVIGSEAGENPIDQGNGPGDGGQAVFEPLKNSYLLDTSGSTDIYLPESNSPGEEVLGLENTSLGETGSANVPYIQVFPSYAETYRQVVESGTIPVSLRNLVRNYFNNLEP